jgi:hypothetical protein
VVEKANCRCGIQCPGQTCICMWDYDEEACTCECPARSPHVGELTVLKALDAQVQITANGLTLAQLGEFLDRYCDASLMIPASDASKKIDLDVDYTTPRAVIDQTGLVIAGTGTGPAAT